MAQLRCPTCDRAVEWSAASPFRPFCSERCRLVDLGAWFSGERAIPADTPPDDTEAQDLSAPSESAFPRPPPRKPTGR